MESLELQEEANAASGTRTEARNESIDPAVGDVTCVEEETGKEKEKELSFKMNVNVMVEDLEQQYLTVLQERESLKDQLERSLKAHREANEDNLAAEELHTRVASLKRELLSSQSQVVKSQEDLKMVQERAARVQLDSDNLREEINRLNELNAKMGAQLANREIEAKLQESEAIPLLHERDRLRTEIESLQTHANWLQGELQARTSSYQRLKHEAHDRQLQLQLQLQQTENDKEAFAVRERELLKIEGRLQTQLEQLSRDMMLDKQELASVKESTALEVQQERKLANLQKEHLLRWEHRYNDVVRENHVLQAAAKEVQALADQQLLQMRQQIELEYQQKFQEKIAEYQFQIQQKQDAQPALAALPAPTEDDDAPIGLTEAYERLEQAKAQLRREKLRADRAELLNQRIVKEIEEKTPLMNRQREEYELAMDQMQEYQSRLEQALQDKEEARADCFEARRVANKWHKQYEEKAAETQLLATQVQTLLLSRAGGDMKEDDVTSVAAMQNQNQRLVVENQRLQNKVNELEGRLNSDEITNKLAAANSELDSLRHQRKLQEEAVEKILQQRDLYRSLCNIGGNLSAEQDQTVQEFSREQMELVKKLQRDLAEADQKFSAVLGERDKLLREKETLDERLLRYEMHNKELTESLNRIEGELHVARGALARDQLEAKFHTDKCLRLEETLQRLRDELGHVTSAKNELQRINAELQHSLAEAKNLVAQKETEKQQAETRLRLAETQAETAKQAQKRATEETNHLRTEVARQGILVDSIRRIESSLTAKRDSEVEALKDEVDQLKKTLANDRTRHEIEVKNWIERANSAEVLFQEAVKAKDKAMADVAIAEKSLEEARQPSSAPKPSGSSVAAQEKIDFLATELSAAQAEVDALRESVEEYKKAAKGVESTALEVSTAAAATKQALQHDLDEVKAQLENMKKESVSKDEVIMEMTQSLAGAREQREKAEAEMKSEITKVKSQLEVSLKDLESSQASFAAVRLDLDTLQGEVSRAQANYERELKLHAEARTALRVAIEKAENEAIERKAASDELSLLKSSIEKERDVWAKEKDSLQKAYQILEGSLKEARDHNSILHSQLEALGAQVQESLSSRSDATQEGGSVANEAQKQLQEMRQVVKFLRSENQMMQTQLDTATRGIEREKAAAGILQHRLDETQAELTALKEYAEMGKSSSTELAAAGAKLAAANEQVALLTDSNKLLREECNRLRESLKTSQEDLGGLRKQLEPSENLKHDYEGKLAALNAENESLRRELDAWKGRVENLVKKFNQVDPVEHQKALAMVEELTKEKEALDKWKITMEEENKRIREIARSLNQKQKEQKSQLDEKDKEIEKLTSEKASSKEASLLKERDELKQKLSNLEKDNKSIKTELDGANVRNGKLRERLLFFKTTIQDLQSKEQSLTQELAAARTAASSNTQEQPSTTMQSEQGVASTPPAQPTADQPKTLPKVSLETPVQQDVVGSVPTVPEGGFNFGPSPSLTAQQKEGEKPAVSSAETSKRPLRPDAAPFSPTKKAETSTSDAQPSQSAGKRQATTETAELSVKAKLLAKKRRLEELTQRKLEANMALNKNDDDKAEASETQQDAKQPVQIEDKSKQQTLESQGVSAIPPASSSVEDSATSIIAPENNNTSDTAPEEVATKDTVDAVMTGATEAEGAEDYDEEPPETEIAETTDENPVIETVKNPFASGSTNPFGSSTSPMIFGQPTSLSATTTTVASSIGSGSGSGGGGFLDMKPPGSSSGPPAFSFGQIKLPMPSQTVPTPSPFSAFTAGSTFGSSFGGFGAFGESQSLPARPLFGSSPSPGDQDEEKDGN